MDFSKEQLLQKLEKSEAGRKKLRQAIIILQEKVDSSEKIVEVNERLRQECEQERQRADCEKKKAEEERRLRTMLEKDSATFRDQLGKVLQRLGSVEIKQNVDKKEMERLRNEVKLSIEGMRASAKAVETTQISFQALESALLEKVKLAYKEAHTASQAVQSLQSSLSSVEKNLSSLEKKGRSPEEGAVVPVALPVSERLVVEITHLFEKEKESHSKIEDRLAMLKSIMMKTGTVGSSVGASDAEKSGYVKEGAHLKEARKRKSRDEELNNRKAKRCGRLYHVDMVSSPFCHVASEEPSSLPGRPLSITTASNDYMDHRGSSTSKVHAPIPSSIDDEAFLQRDNGKRESDDVSLQRMNEKRELCPEQKGGRVLDASREASKETDVKKKSVLRHKDERERVERVSDVSLRVSKETVAHKKGIIRHRDEREGIRARGAGMSTGQADEPRVDEESDSDLDIEWGDSIEDEWFENLTLLTPSLPEIASPICRGSSPSREPPMVDERFKVQYDRFSELLSDQVQTHAASSHDVLPASNISPAIDLPPDTPQNEISSFLEDLPPLLSDLANTIGLSGLSQDPHKAEMPRISETDISQDRVAPDMAMEEEGLKEIATTFRVSGLSQDPHEAEVPMISETDISHDTVAQDERATCSREDGSNLFAVLGSRTTHVCASSCTVFLLQAFDLDNTETKVNMAAACIVAAYFRECLHLANSEKLHKALPAGSADVPLEYLTCGLISTAVEVTKSNSAAAHRNLGGEPAHSIVLFLVALIRSAFKELSNPLFDAMFTQLSRFLSKGEGMLITLQGLVSPMTEADVYGIVQGVHTKENFACQYSEAALEDVRAGGKVLAALCRVLSCVAHLQSVAYELLGSCGKDVEWLLTIFSSFSSICGPSAFLSEADDLLGCAICAIIIELVASVVDDKQGKILNHDGVDHKLTHGSTHLSSSYPNRWAGLMETLEAKGKFRMEEVLMAVLASLHSLVSGSFEILHGVEVGDPVLRGTPLPDKEAEKGAVSRGHMSLDCERWQKKYAEMLGALELISLFMGWEWTYNNLISRYLWKRVASGSAQVCAAGTAHILSVLTRMGMKSKGNELPGLDELRKSLAYVVASPSTLVSKAERHLLTGL